MTKEILSAYLPYDVKIEVERTAYPRSKEIETLTYLHFGYPERKYNFKPLLRPLSSLTKPIVHEGKTVDVIKEIGIYDPNNIPYLIEQITTGLVEKIVWDILLKYHFNCFNLADEEYIKIED